MKRRVNTIVARSNITLLLISAAVLVGALFLASISTIPYFSAKLSGGRILSNKAITGYSDSLPVYFAQVNGDEMVDTGYYKETTYYSIPVGTSYIGALALDDRYLIVQLPSEVSESQTHYTGTLDPLPGELNRQVVAQIELEFPQVRGAFLPIYLNVVDAERGWYWYVGAVVLAIVLLASLYGLFLAVSRFANPKNHPIWKRLERYKVDTDHLLKNLDADLQRGSSKVGKLTLSNDWIVQPQGNNFDVIRIPDVTWMYMHVQKTKAYGVITVGKVYSAYIWDLHGVHIVAKGKEAAVQEMLTSIAQRAPWAILGYTDQLKQAWDKDRVGFVRQVAERRKQTLYE